MEGRRQERKQIIYYLRVFDAQTGTLLGHVADLSTKGFMLTCEQKLAKGKTMQLRVDLPKSMGSARQLDFKARVTWSKPDAKSDFYKTGLKVLQIAKNDEQTLADLIQNFLYQEPPEGEESLEKGN